MASFDHFTAAFVTLIVVVEPFGLAPIFLAAPRAMARGARAGIAARASLFAFLILVGAALIGEWLLAALGISMAAFRIAGGLLLFSIASEMVLGLRIARDARAAKQALDENIHDPAAFPLAMQVPRRTPRSLSLGSLIWLSFWQEGKWDSSLLGGSNAA